MIPVNSRSPSRHAVGHVKAIRVVTGSEMAPASSPTSSRVWALHLLISVFGITLRVWQYIVDRSLWHDEARLANAILSRSFIDLTKPMTEQISPIGFLLVERVNVTLFGMGE